MFVFISLLNGSWDCIWEPIRRSVYRTRNMITSSLVCPQRMSIHSFICLITFGGDGVEITFIQQTIRDIFILFLFIEQYVLTFCLRFWINWNTLKWDFDFNYSFFFIALANLFPYFYHIKSLSQYSFNKINTGLWLSTGFTFTGQRYGVGWTFRHHLLHNIYLCFLVHYICI